MANSETFTSDRTVTIGNTTKKTDHDQLADNTDYLHEAVSAIMDPAEAVGLKGSWQDPLFLRGSASIWMAQWLDNTDTANIQLRLKSGTSQAAATPSSMTDGVVVGTGGII